MNCKHVWEKTFTSSWIDTYKCNKCESNLEYNGWWDTFYFNGKLKEDDKKYRKLNLDVDILRELCNEQIQSDGAIIGFKD